MKPKLRAAVARCGPRVVGRGAHVEDDNGPGAAPGAAAQAAGVGARVQCRGEAR